ncbi:hypothetical protein V6N12_026842 [Hibiscus sabdariffa]|uniref:Uncharacterized protein n=1 Tax=Hibiscus sabdariffa TaxID=183260 RepID=A0ABR2DSZ6_9ROSI
MSENPKEVNPSLAHHGNANGRPPDLVTNLGIPPILERQASPLEVGEQQIAKKSKNNGSSLEHNITGGDAIGMETDVDMSSQQQHLLNTPSKETYASMAAKGRSGSGEHDAGRDSESDEIVVHDEDCIIDESGAFPTIPPQEEVVQPAIQNFQVGDNKNLYGPWMIATSRRRRAAKIYTRGEVHGLDQGYTGGSQFANLPVEEIRGDGSKDLAPSEAPRGGSVVEGGHKESRDGSRLEHVVPQKTFTKNAAYLASNPERKNKKSSGAGPSLSEINVVPLADGNGAHIVKHTAIKGMGNHNAISIDEPGYDANGGTSSKGAKGRKGSFREGGEYRRLGFKVGKQNSERGAPTYSLMEWASNMSNHIDAIAAQDKFQLSAQARSRNLHADMELSSEEGGEIADNSMDAHDLAVESDVPAHEFEQ